MASRVKKIFHRKSQNFQPEPLQGENGPVGVHMDPTLRATPYDTTAPGGLPETGAYPIRGDGSSTSTAMQESVPSHYDPGHQGVRNDLPYSPPTSKQRSAVEQPTFSNTAPRNNHPYSGSSDTYPSNPTSVKDRTGGRDPGMPLSQDLSRLSLGDGDARGTQTPPRRSLQASGNFDRATPHQSSTTHGNSPIRMVGEDSMPQSHNITATTGPHSFNFETTQRPSNEFQDDLDLRRRTSIPRKQVGSSPKAYYSGNTSPTAPYNSAGHNSRASIEKPLPSAPAFNHNPHQPGSRQDLVQPSNGLDRSRPIPRSTGGAAYTAQELVRRAQHDSVDTEVIETIAPAIVHENVQKQVHHVREEVVTREIHDHEVYHRILPVVDVEVLPPRHFLPVEGGGLVEISSSEVPGRGKNWVIAETASKIPSNQSAPVRPTRFSAREFHGTEGDARSYETPEGFDRTEQTWVHPPELETGGRDSGQTWPMVFGDVVPGKHRGLTSGTSHKTRDHKETSFEHSTPLAGAEQLGRAL